MDPASASASAVAAEAVFHTVVRILGEDNKRIVASFLGESAQGLTDVLTGHRGSLDRVASWVWSWNASGAEQLVMNICGNDEVHVLPVNVDRFFELREVEGRWTLWVRTAPDQWRQAGGTYSSGELSQIPRETLVEAWESARLERSSSVERALKQARTVRWEICTSGKGALGLRSASFNQDWGGDSEWSIAFGRNVAAIRVRGQGAGRSALERTSDDFTLRLGNAEIATRHVIVAPMDDDECVIIIRPVPKESELLNAVGDGRAVTVFRLDP